MPRPSRRLHRGWLSSVPSWLSLARRLVAPLVEGRGWRMCSVGFSSVAEQRSFDTQVLAVLPMGDGLRRRWMERVPRLLGRERPPRRALWLTDAEAKTLGNV